MTPPTDTAAANAEPIGRADLEAAIRGDTAPVTSGTDDSLSCFDKACGCVVMVGGVIAGLALILVRVGYLCLFVSGLIFTASEFGDIPRCAHRYQAWSITMVVICFMSFTRKSHIEADASEYQKVLGACLLVMSVLPGLVAGLGTRYMIDGIDSSCDTTGIHQLEDWTRWVVGFHWALMGLMQLFGVVAIVCQE